MDSDRQERIDELYRLPLAEFIPARNALAAELKRADDPDHAAVKALAKPGVPAWVVNQLWHRQRDDFESLFDAGERLRAEQQRGLQGRGAGSASATGRRKAIAGLLRHAELILTEEGRPATPATLKRVEKTLQALADLGRGGSDEPPGRLTREVEPPGFDALLALAAAPPLAPPPEPEAEKAEQDTAAVPAAPRAVPSPPPDDTAEPVSGGESVEEGEALERRARAARLARGAVTAAVEGLDRARATAGEAEAARAAAAARVRQTVAEVSRLKTELARAEKSAGRARVALERAETRKDQADEAVRSAERALAEARTAAERARFDPGG